MSREKLANVLGVSLSSVTRWEAGISRPNPISEGRLRKILNGEMIESTKGIAPTQAGPFSQVRHEFFGTLKKLREAVHRSGNISSRNEALEELARLLLAHVYLISTSGSGIEAIARGRGSALRLNAQVENAALAYVSPSLRQHFGRDGLKSHLPADADIYADEIISSFSELSTDLVVSCFSGHQGTDVLNEAFGQFLSHAFADEKELGQYLTPNTVVRYMVSTALESLPSEELNNLLNPHGCAAFGHILDPSCGTASFLSEAARLIYRRVYSDQGEDAAYEWLHNAMGEVFVGVDKSDRMIHLALSNLSLLGAERVNIHSANALREAEDEGGVLTALKGKASLILTNPPFGAEYSGNDLASSELVHRWATKTPKTVNSELLFLERYADWLRVGGVLSAIVPDSILYNKGLFEDLRRGLSGRFELVSCTSLPSATFAAAGTRTKTSVILLRRTDTPDHTRPVFFGICDDVGYEVSSRGAQWKVNETGQSQLPQLARHFADRTQSERSPLSEWVHMNPSKDRWDPNHYLSVPKPQRRFIEENTCSLLRIGDFFHLATDKRDPRRTGEECFQYIEISDVDPLTNVVSSKEALCEAAPVRARKVVKAGDILVSTVRPDRRVIGVVPDELDGAICSTGFAVLRSTSGGVEPLVVAKLLQSDFATVQIGKYNVGISYPVIPEDCLLDVLLPSGRAHLQNLNDVASRLGAARRSVGDIQREFDAAVELALRSTYLS